MQKCNHLHPSSRPHRISGMRTVWMYSGKPLMATSMQLRRGQLLDADKPDVVLVRDRDALDAALSGNRVQMELLVEANMDASQVPKPQALNTGNSMHLLHAS